MDGWQLACTDYAAVVVTDNSGSNGFGACEVKTQLMIDDFKNSYKVYVVIADEVKNLTDEVKAVAAESGVTKVFKLVNAGFTVAVNVAGRLSVIVEKHQVVDG